ncbi:FdhD protein [Marmoricola sp. OAE513]|uniref:formate dehydrogenase accessory sulfurtransferase FdhD n=1 Tax=Marmoricola sp. OAE513 TaxID=2817894 RepID=UPI001D2B70F7
MTARERRPGPTVRTRVTEVRPDLTTHHEDRLATEEPLEIRLAWPGAPARRAGVTMRTPGHDFELAVGWLVHEQVLARDAVSAVRYCTDADLSDLEEFNVVTVESDRAPLRLPESRLVSSACGVCGSESIADVLRDVPAGQAGQPGQPGPVIGAAVVGALPQALREHQGVFERTGGLHAAGLFTEGGELVVVREDVGRHNAVDKVVGSRILAGASVPGVLVLSGRVGFELVQKAVVSGIGAVVAVGAPSSLAVRLASEAGVGLVGFTRPDRFVVYAGGARFGV